MKVEIKDPISLADLIKKAKETNRPFNKIILQLEENEDINHHHKLVVSTVLYLKYN